MCWILYKKYKNDVLSIGTKVKKMKKKSPISGFSTDRKKKSGLQQSDAIHHIKNYCNVSLLIFIIKMLKLSHFFQM